MRCLSDRDAFGSMKTMITSCETMGKIGEVAGMFAGNMLVAAANNYAPGHSNAVKSLVAPDTSPRGEGVADGPAGDWDFGLGAGFYLDAVRSPWADHYNMYSYVTEELAELIDAQFPSDPRRQGIFGHSMGGHGTYIFIQLAPEYFAAAAPSAGTGLRRTQPFIDAFATTWHSHAHACTAGN